MALLPNLTIVCGGFVVSLQWMCGAAATATEGHTFQPRAVETL